MDEQNNPVAKDSNGCKSSPKDVEPDKEPDKEPGKEPDKEPEKENMDVVGFFQVFRYATKLDIILMVLGTLGAVIHGAGMPCLLIIFGDMTNEFIQTAKLDNTTLQTLQSCNLEQYGTTLPEVQADFQLLGEVLTHCNQSALLQHLMDNMYVGLRDQIGNYAIYFTIVGIIVILTGYVQVTCWRSAALRQAQLVRTLAFRQILKMEIGWFDTHQVGELNNRLNDDVNRISEGIGEKVSNFFQWMSTFFVGIIVGFAYGWKLALVILACSPLLAAAGGFVTWIMSAFTKAELTAYAMAGAVAEEVLGAIRTVVAFGGQDKETLRYGSHLHKAKAFGIKKSIIGGGGIGAVYFVLFATYALAFWYGSSLVRSEEYTPGQMLIVFFCVLIGAFALGKAAPNIQDFSTARGAAYVLWELLDRKSEIDSSSDEGLKPEVVNGNITFSDVHFNYPSRPDVPVLCGLNLEVAKGQMVALVGSSGCGKSTTVQLLQRFYDSCKGQVTIDGEDIRNLNIKWLRSNIGMVSQEPVLFGTTIKENIVFGKDGATDEEVVAAAKKANAHDFISKLPQKYETLVGERGAQLSGGQKQRIAIARALIHDPRILLLDEATSALDTESEAVVQEALDKARQGRTTLVIAHRLSTIKSADHIYSIHEGKVFEQGTHDELMEKGEAGIYYHLVTNQQHQGDHFEEIDISEIEPSFKRQASVRASGRKDIIRALSREDKIDEPEAPQVSMLRIMKLNAPELPYILLGCLCAVISGGSMPAFAVIFAEILGVYAEPPGEQERLANLYSAMFLVIGIVSGLAMFLQSFMFGVAGETLTVRIRTLLFSAYMRQEMSFFDIHTNSVGALCTRLSTDASAVQGATGVRLGSIIQSLASIGTGIAIGFAFSWKLTLLILAFVPFITIAGALQFMILSGKLGKDQGQLEEAGKVAIEAIENVRVVASITKEDHFTDAYTKLTETPFRNDMKKAHAVGLAFSFSEGIIFFAYAGIFYLGAYLVETKDLYFDDMFKVFAAIVFGTMAVGQATAFAPDYNKAKQAAARVFQQLDIVPSIDCASSDGDKLDAVKGAVSFKDIEFSYPSRPTVKVLKNFELEIEPGQKVALVGSSGSGKSTIVSLLERFYDPAQGSLSIDGKPLNSINVQSLRQSLGIVQQEPILFDTSIHENISYGNNFAEVTMEEIIKAARDANIHSFIESLPHGYETNVGAKGTQLSGGQKQRIAIARALVRNPKILLLDEATSALDTESEKVVQEALDRAQQGRTSIVIAHRLSTIRQSDVIIVLDGGVVTEQGTHSELMAKGGLYYRLTKAQARKQ